MIGTDTQELFLIAIKVASWSWTIIAFLAGKLMSNDWVYASGIGLDKTLFSMWNYMKNIANFAVGFIFVAGVLKGLFEKDVFSIKKNLPKYLLASVLINMSWFLMGVLVDVSNVATAAIGSFPQALVGENVTKDTQFKELITSIPQKIEVNLNNNTSNRNGCLASDYYQNEDIDKVWARANDMSGPLLFLGTSIYRFQSYCQSANSQNGEILPTTLKDFTIGMSIKIIILLMFMVPLVALLIINLKRIFYLWLWIVFAPIIVLIEVLGVKIDAGKMKNMFSFKEVIGMVFAPVFIVGGMALVLILSTGMYYVLGGSPRQNPDQTIVQSFDGMEIRNSKEASTFANVLAGSEITFQGSIFDEATSYAGGLIGYIIISSFVIMLLWAIVKMSVSGSEIAKSTYKGVADLGGKLAGSFNFIPIGDGKKISLETLKSATNGSELQNQINTRTAQWSESSNNALYKAVYGSALGKSFRDAYNIKWDPYQDEYYNINVKTLGLPNSGHNTIGDYMAKLKNKLDNQKNHPLKELRRNSDKFLSSLTDEIVNNQGLSDNLKALLKQYGQISDEKFKKDSAGFKAQLLDSKNEIGRVYMQYIQEALNHNGPAPHNTINNPKVKTIGDNFVFYKSPSEKKADTPESGTNNPPSGGNTGGTTPTN